MKIAIVTDDHFGVRNESSLFARNIDRFYRECFFPVVDQENIRTVFHLGDLVDRKKYATFQTVHQIRRTFIEPLLNRGMSLHIVPGNHDIPGKTTLSVNAVRELLHPYSSIWVHDEPAVGLFEDRYVLFVPWICDGNKDKTFSLMTKGADFCMGHLELSGFEAYRGHVMEKGLNPSDFDKFKIVCSGHYHHKSTRGNIHYLGATREMTWSDCDDARGFHILDTATRELTFYRNPFPVFSRIVYDDVGGTNIPDNLQDRIVRVTVKEKTQPKTFDKMLSVLEKQGVSEIQVVEDRQFGLEAATVDLDNIAQTETVLRAVVEELDYAGDKTALNNLVVELYREAARDSA